MEKQRLYQLLSAFAAGQLSETEKQELAVMLNDDSKMAEQHIIQMMQEMPEQQMANKQEWSKLLHEVIAVDKTAEHETPVRSIKISWWRYAAAVILLIGMGTIVYFYTNKEEAVTVVKTNETDIAPGGEKAILTLADGTTIILDNAANGKLAQQGNTQVVKLSNGEITYNASEENTKAILWNTMSTPAAGQYQVTLPDGTKAWLNAMSSITYPTTFTGKTREVKIKGEVYFEVTSNKQKPFIVDIEGRSTVEVLGTSFNINAYDNEENIKTTLLEGSVKINANNQSAILKPGQQAVVDQTLSVNPNANIDQAIAWKKGLFSFNDTGIKSVMRQLERWYDVKVTYQGAAPDISLKGKMYRNVNLSAVIDFLQKTGVNCHMEGKTIIVE